MRYLYWLIAALIFSSACVTKASVDSLSAAGPFQSKRFIHKTESRSSGIDLEIIRTESGFFGYLAVHSYKIYPIASDTNVVHIHFSSLESSWQADGLLHKGGQRIALTPDIIERLLEMAKKSEVITITIEGFEEIIGCRELLSGWQLLQQGNGFSEILSIEKYHFLLNK